MLFLIFALLPLSVQCAALTSGETIYACTYIDDQCTILPPIEADCKYLPFNECLPAPSKLVDFHYITSVVGEDVTYQRYLDNECKVPDKKWRVEGKLGECFGPVAEQLGLSVYNRMQIAENGAAAFPAFATGAIDQFMTTAAIDRNDAMATTAADLPTLVAETSVPVIGN